MTSTWEPKTGEWVAVRRADESKPWGHRRRRRLHIDYYGTVRPYRLNRRGEWANNTSVPRSVLMPATRPQAELEAEFMREVRDTEWTDHTFNPWWGCEKVSPGCAHCYADTFSRRVGYTDEPHDGEPGSQTGPKVRLWGPGSERRMFGDKHWNEPLRWNREAEKAGTRALVFCASMADVFEDRPELVAPRARLFALIQETPHLDWLLLTKRPENAARLWGEAADVATTSIRDVEVWPRNIWLGTTVEDQRRADERIPHLLAVPAVVRFLSCEPLLGPVDLFAAMFGEGYAFKGEHPDIPGCNTLQFVDGLGHGVDWVIAGGESGPGARPMHPDWARSLRDQCAAAGVPFLFKQWGNTTRPGPGSARP
jgi:protein gp37